MIYSDEIIEDLVSHFGDIHEEEITNSFSSKNKYSDYGDCGSFMVDYEKYNYILNEDECDKIAVELIKNKLLIEDKDLNDAYKIISEKSWVPFLIPSKDYFYTRKGLIVWKEEVKNEGLN